MDGLKETTLDFDPASGRAKRGQILDGARSVFTRLGFDGASVNDIAAAAGVSKGTLYAYFDSKERLFETMIREDRAQQAERLLDFAADAADAPQLLKAFGLRLIDTMLNTETLPQTRMVLAACAKFPELGRAFYDAGPCLGRNRLADVLRKLVDRGALSVEDCEEAAGHFIDMVHGAAVKPALFCAQQSLSQAQAERIVESALRVFMSAYGPRPAAA
jgi:AcrR family transcriptional regulator